MASAISQEPAGGLLNDDTKHKEPHMSSKLLYAYQWLVLLLLGPPLLVMDILLALPLAVLLWITGAVNYGKKLAAQRDPVLLKVLETDSKGRSPVLASLTALGRVYTSLVAFGIHNILSLFVRVARPRTVFVVYTSNYHLMRKFFCVGTGELIARAGLSKGSM